MPSRERRTVIGCMALLAMLLMACHEGNQSTPDRQPDGVDGGLGKIGCEMASADDFESAQMAAEGYFACLYPGVDVKTACELRPDWLLPLEFERGDIQDVWIIGRPVVECEALLRAEGPAPRVLGASVQTLDPVTLPPLRARWGVGRYEEVPCLVGLLRTGREPAVSAETWATRLRERAACHPQVETIVDCWAR